MPRIVVRTVFLALVFAGSATAQVKNNVPDIVPGARPVPVEHIKVHGASLEGNLEGDAADRDVLVFLPPSYAADRNRRYPVVYALHGYFIGAEQWSKELHVPQTIEGAFAKGAPVRILLAGATGASDLYWYVPAASPLKSFKDLDAPLVE